MDDFSSRSTSTESTVSSGVLGSKKFQIRFAFKPESIRQFTALKGYLNDLYDQDQMPSERYAEDDNGKENSLLSSVEPSIILYDPRKCKTEKSQKNFLKKWFSESYKTAPLDLRTEAFQGGLEEQKLLARAAIALPLFIQEKILEKGDLLAQAMRLYSELQVAPFTNLQIHQRMLSDSYESILEKAIEQKKQMASFGTLTLEAQIDLLQQRACNSFQQILYEANPSEKEALIKEYRQIELRLQEVCAQQKNKKLEEQALFKTNQAKEEAKKRAYFEAYSDLKTSLNKGSLRAEDKVVLQYLVRYISSQISVNPSAFDALWNNQDPSFLLDFKNFVKTYNTLLPNPKGPFDEVALLEADARSRFNPVFSETTPYDIAKQQYQEAQKIVRNAVESRFKKLAHSIEIDSFHQAQKDILLLERLYPTLRSQKKLFDADKVHLIQETIADYKNAFFKQKMKEKYQAISIQGPQKTAAQFLAQHGLDYHKPFVTLTEDVDNLTYCYQLQTTPFLRKLNRLHEEMKKLQTGTDSYNALLTGIQQLSQELSQIYFKTEDFFQDPQKANLFYQEWSDKFNQTSSELITNSIDHYAAAIEKTGLAIPANAFQTASMIQDLNSIGFLLNHYADEHRYDYQFAYSGYDEDTNHKIATQTTNNLSTEEIQAFLTERSQAELNEQAMRQKTLGAHFQNVSSMMLQDDNLRETAIQYAATINAIASVHQTHRDLIRDAFQIHRGDQRIAVTKNNSDGTVDLDLVATRKEWLDSSSGFPIPESIKTDLYRNYNQGNEGYSSRIFSGIALIQGKKQDFSENDPIPYLLGKESQDLSFDMLSEKKMQVHDYAIFHPYESADPTLYYDNRGVHAIVHTTISYTEEEQGPHEKHIAKNIESIDMRFGDTMEMLRYFQLNTARFDYRHCDNPLHPIDSLGEVLESEDLPQRILDRHAKDEVQMSVAGVDLALYGDLAHTDPTAYARDFFQRYKKARAISQNIPDLDPSSNLQREIYQTYWKIFYELEKLKVLERDGSLQDQPDMIATIQKASQIFEKLDSKMTFAQLENVIAVISKPCLDSVRETTASDIPDIVNRLTMPSFLKIPGLVLDAQLASAKLHNDSDEKKDYLRSISILANQYADGHPANQQIFIQNIAALMLEPSFQQYLKDYSEYLVQYDLDCNNSTDANNTISKQIQSFWQSPLPKELETILMTEPLNPEMLSKEVEKIDHKIVEALIQSGLSGAEIISLHRLAQKSNDKSSEFSNELYAAVQEQVLPKSFDLLGLMRNFYESHPRHNRLLSECIALYDKDTNTQSLAEDERRDLLMTEASLFGQAAFSDSFQNALSTYAALVDQNKAPTKKQIKKFLDEHNCSPSESFVLLSLLTRKNPPLTAQELNQLSGSIPLTPTHPVIAKIANYLHKKAELERFDAMIIAFCEKAQDVSFRSHKDPHIASIDRALKKRYSAYMEERKARFPEAESFVHLQRLTTLTLGRSSFGLDAIADFLQRTLALFRVKDSIKNFDSVIRERRSLHSSKSLMQSAVTQILHEENKGLSFSVALYAKARAVFSKNAKTSQGYFETMKTKLEPYIVSSRSTQPLSQISLEGVTIHPSSKKESLNIHLSEEAIDILSGDRTIDSASLTNEPTHVFAQSMEPEEKTTLLIKNAVDAVAQNKNEDQQIVIDVKGSSASFEDFNHKMLAIKKILTSLEGECPLLNLAKWKLSSSLVKKLEGIAIEPSTFSEEVRNALYLEQSKDITMKDVIALYKQRAISDPALNKELGSFLVAAIEVCATSKRESLSRKT